MPLFESALGSALLTKGAVGGAGAHLLSSFLEGHPLQHFDHSHIAAALGGHNAASALAHHMDLPGHQDFLFGATPLTIPSAGSLLSTKHLTSLVSTANLAPKLSMVAGFTSAASLLVNMVSKKAKVLDPFEDDEEEKIQLTGWCRHVPRALKVSIAFDALSALVLGQSWGSYCSVPLKSWLAGGIALGFPLSALVQKVAKQRPSFKHYRLTVTALRGGGDPNTAKLDSLVLYDQFNFPVDGNSMAQQQTGSSWLCSLQNGGELVTGYQIVTHRTSPRETDPSAWTFEASMDGVTWQVIDDVDGHELPTARGTRSTHFDDLAHLEESTKAFRGAFLLEVVANAAAFAWLVAGTSWVSQGADVCVDSAPLLWHYCYLLVVLVWSFLGTITIGLIISAVAMIVLGVKSSPSA